MALKRLTTGEMVQLSEPMVTEGTEVRAAILAVPALAGVVPNVEAAYQALNESQKGAENPRITQLREQATEVDLKHDTLIRGMYQLLGALALLAATPEKGDELLRIRDVLLPEGLAATQKTFREEAGAATLLQTRIADGAIKKQLKEIPVFKQTAWHFVEAWMGHARKLGELESERAKLMNTVGPSDDARMVAARNQWIRAINAMVAMAELAEIDPQTDTLIFGELRIAEKAADRRAKTSVAPEPEQAPAPTEAVKAPV